MSRLRTIVGMLAGTALVSGCSHYEPLSLHGAASLRVESEVYKGPATLSISAQIGQNTAVLADLVRALDVWLTEARLYYPPTSLAMSRGACRPSNAAGRADDAASAGSADDPCSDVPDLWHSKARKTHAPPLIEDAYALPDADGVCRTPGDATGAKGSLRDWKDCAALGAAMASARRAVVHVCFIINSPAFSQLRVGTSLPFNTCEKSAYKDEWSYLLREHPILDDLQDYGIAGSQSEQEVFQQQPAYLLARTLLSECQGYRKGQATDDEKGQAASSPPMKRSPPLGSTAAVFACYNEPIVIAMESLATTLRASAFRAADSTIRHVPRNRQFRGLIAAYAYIASEYGGQISARINILNKAMVQGRDHRNLPTSDFLRGAGSTDFVHLIEWLDAGDKRYGIAFADYPDLPSRVRMAERLNADSYWEKFNEVHTSGQGDVATAFVKNDLGNWDLKGFRNDPAKLLAAYRKTTDAVLASAAKLATRAASGGVGAATQRLSASQKAIDLANQLAGARPQSAGADTAALHARVVARIEAQRDALVARRAELVRNLDALPDKTSEDARMLQARIDDIPATAALSYRLILEEHAGYLTAAQEAIAAAPPDGAKP